MVLFLQIKLPTGGSVIVSDTKNAFTGESMRNELSVKFEAEPLDMTLEQEGQTLL